MFSSVELEMSISLIKRYKLHKNMLSKHISGPKMDPSETRKGQSFQELNEVPILVLYFLIFSSLSSCI